MILQKSFQYAHLLIFVTFDQFNASLLIKSINLFVLSEWKKQNHTDPQILLL